ncbi:MAG: nucleotidyltransferase domain-containing protein [Myxococcales bacterium]|nr:MAG: nucleotidyltransferase domain-containing protein [Myxococcales bacterium]
MTEKPENLIEHITRRIVEAFHPRRIVLFGSRARGDARPDSDYDFFVEMETDQKPSKRRLAISKLFGIREWAMDIIVYTPEEVEGLKGVKSSFLSVIEQEGRVLYEQ